MKMRLLFVLLLAVPIWFFCSCSESDADMLLPSETDAPSLIVKFKFDKTQQRLDNFGNPKAVGAGNAAISPDFNSISAHYFELAPTAYTQLGDGAVLYHAPETTMGGALAIDFSQSKIVAEEETFLKIPLKDLPPGSYEWVRCSLSYQNYNIPVRANGTDFVGTLASFVGFRSYIGTHEIGNNLFPIDANKEQGYWAFALNDYPYVTDGQAPAGSTTVPNPLSDTSPIPAGSCVVTGKFLQNLTITGNEKRDVVVTLSLSVNKSFEWQEVVTDGKYEPGAGETVVDMGLRGLIPSWVMKP